MLLSSNCVHAVMLMSVFFYVSSSGCLGLVCNLRISWSYLPTFLIKEFINKILFDSSKRMHNVGNQEYQMVLKHPPDTENTMYSYTPWDFENNPSNGPKNIN